MPFRRCASQVHDRATPTNAKPVPRYAMPSPCFAIQALPSLSRAWPCRRCAPLCPAGTAPSFAAAWQSKAVPMRGGTLRFPRCAAPISANAQRAYALPQRCPAGRCDAAASLREAARRCADAIRCIPKPPPCFATPCRCLAFPSSALPPPCRADQSRCRALPSKTSAMPTKAVALPSFAAPCRGSALPCPPSPVQPGALPSLCCAHHGRAVAMHAGAFLRRRGYSVPNSFTPSSS